MEKMLYHLFDLQSFSGNDRLAEIIADTEKRYGSALSDDELEALSAAGEPVPPHFFGLSGEDKSDD